MVFMSRLSYFVLIYTEEPYREDQAIPQNCRGGGHKLHPPLAKSRLNRRVSYERGVSALSTISLPLCPTQWFQTIRRDNKSASPAT
jgi:hypothetical protein